MHKAYIKDCLRQIKVTFNRFISIVIISALGVAFFAGLRTSGNDMRITAEEYYDSLNFFDIHLISVYGFTNDDIGVLAGISSIKEIDAVYSFDAIAKEETKNYTVKLMSYSPEDSINLPSVKSGRLPQKSGECVVDTKFIQKTGKSIGDKVFLESGTKDALKSSIKQDEYTILGTVDSPLYISVDRGSSTVGSGDNDAFIILPSQDFLLPAFTDIYIKVPNSDKASRFDDAYDTLLNLSLTAIEEKGTLRSKIRYEEIILSAKQETEKVKEEVKNGYEKLAESEQELNDSRAELDKGWSEYTKNKTDFEEQIKEAYSKLNKGKTEYKNGLSGYKKSTELLQLLNKLIAQGNNAQALESIKGIAASLQNTNPSLASLLYAYSKAPEDMTVTASVKNALEQFSASLTASKTILDKTKATLDKNEKELKKAESESKTKLDDALKKLNDGETDYEKGKKEFEDKKTASLSDLKKAEEKIADAEKDISEINYKDWYVLDLNTNADFLSYDQNTNRIDAISIVMPFLFFLIAVLVNMTSMTRLVESDRSLIGTFKALGYSNNAIALRYVFYAVSASLVGSVFGLVAGYNIFPRVIFDAYGILYTLPPIKIVYSNYYSFLSVTSAVLCAALPAFLVCEKSLRTSAAGLMRPVSPKIGKKTFLERIKPFWKRLNFSQKVAFRNLFRYKKRLVMTIVGVAGCTSLMFAGFGLRDSITTIIDKQFDTLHKYNLVVHFGKNDANNADDSILNVLDSTPGISGKALSFSDTCELSNDKLITSVNLIVPSDIKQFSSFVVFRTRTGHDPVELTDNGVVISEKLSSMYDLAEGDSFEVKSSDGSMVKLKVSGITENYLVHYIYASPDYYEKTFRKEFSPNEAFCKTTGDEQKIAEELLSGSSVTSVTITSNLSKSFSKMTDALRYVVLVLISSAATLVFVVLFSLNTINIEERNRELATLKVLGFYNPELAAYIYRENAFLTIVGTVFGLFFGVALERYIIATMEVDLVMFSRDLLWSSYVFSALLTLLFAAAVNLIMIRHISKINVVASMKSVE